MPHQPQGPATTGFAPVWRDECTQLVFGIGPFVLWSPSLLVQVSRAVLPTPLSSPDALAAPLAEQPLKGDGFLLYGHRVSSPLPKHFRVNGLLGYVLRSAPQYTADLTLGIDAYWATFSGKARYNLRRTLRLFQEASGHALHWRMFQTPAELPEFHRLAQALSVQTYQHKLFDHGLPDTPDFVADMLAKGAQGHAWGCVLYWQGEVCAYLYFAGEGDVLSWDFAGYSPDLARWSPGTVLMSLAMESFLGQGRYRYMDFGPGEGQHKAVFSTSCEPMATVYLLRPTWRNLALVWAHRVFTALVDGCMGLLKRTGLHQWVKRNLKRAVQTPSGVGAR